MNFLSTKNLAVIRNTSNRFWNKVHWKPWKLEKKIETNSCSCFTFRAKNDGLISHLIFNFPSPQNHPETPSPVNVETHIGLSFFLCFLFPVTGIPALICSLKSRKAIKEKSLPSAAKWARRAFILNVVGGVIVLLLLLSYVVWLVSWWLTPFQPPATYKTDSEVGQNGQEHYRTYIVTKSPPLTYPTTGSL
jgi:hypothetical protein